MIMGERWRKSNQPKQCTIEGYITQIAMCFIHQIRVMMGNAYPRWIRIFLFLLGIAHLLCRSWGGKGHFRREFFPGNSTQYDRERRERQRNLSHLVGYLSCSTRPT